LADFTPLGQNWWPNKWREIFISGGMAAQSQSGENNTFYHLDKTDNKLKLTDFQEKSS
jgi:hypothetical protein